MRICDDPYEVVECLKCDNRFLRIDFDEAVLAAYLPVQQFKKASESKVWSDSRRMI